MIYYIKFHRVDKGISCFDSSCGHEWIQGGPGEYSPEFFAKLEDYGLVDDSDNKKIGLRSVVAEVLNALPPENSVISIVEIQQSVNYTKEIVVWVSRE